jgi:hypothetical protein
MTSPVWPDWATLQSYHDRTWAILNDHLAGREEFESAAARIAAIIREEMHDPRRGRTTPSTGDGSSVRPMWMITFPVPTIADGDRPRVSKLFDRAVELFGQAVRDGAA